MTKTLTNNAPLALLAAVSAATLICLVLGVQSLIPTLVLAASFLIVALWQRNFHLVPAFLAITVDAAFKLVGVTIAFWPFGLLIGLACVAGYLTLPRGGRARLHRLAETQEVGLGQGDL